MALKFNSQRYIVTYHTEMLSDADRMGRYRDAIHEVVRAGDIVLDVGTGTGILAYFACQAGASHVYAVESGPVIALARELCERNGFADRVSFLSTDSYRAELPEKADVLVTETLWNFGLGEGVLGTMLDAHARLMKSGARIVPSSISMVAVPVEAPLAHGQLVAPPADAFGLDLSPLRGYNANNLHQCRLSEDAFLASPLTIAELDLTVAPTSSDISVKAEYLLRRGGMLHGLGGWFESELAPGISLTNRPGVQSHWAHALLPLECPVKVRPGDRARVTLATISNGAVWRWRVELVPCDHNRSVMAADHTTFFGFPVDTG